MAQGKTADHSALYRNRRSFAKIPDVMDMPNLISVQTDSFAWFTNEGLAQAFKDISPIENSTKDMCVEFGDHRIPGDEKTQKPVGEEKICQKGQKKSRRIVSSSQVFQLVNEDQKAENENCQ